MVRYPRGHKEKTRDQIVDTAARAFREEGVAGVGIGELMGRAGLTHGGFYAHFPSKDALVAEACSRAVDDPAFSDRILKVCRGFWTDAFAGDAPAAPPVA